MKVNIYLLLGILIVISTLQIASSSLALIHIKEAKKGDYTNKQKRDRRFLIVMIIVSSIIIAGSIFLLYIEFKENMDEKNYEKKYGKNSIDISRFNSSARPPSRAPPRSPPPTRAPPRSPPPTRVPPRSPAPTRSRSPPPRPPLPNISSLRRSPPPSRPPTPRPRKPYTVGK